MNAPCHPTRRAFLTRWRPYIPLGLALLLAAMLKVGLILTGAVPFNGDEAVVALMARHILQGATPTFFYGQAYMGSLDAWLIAGAFRLFGQEVFAIRLVHALLYLLYLLTAWILARRFFKTPLVADFAVLAAAIPPVLVTTYTTATLGGYGESLVLGNLILLLGYQVLFAGWGQRWWAWLLLGVLGGFAFWVLGIAGVYLLPLGLLGLSKFKAKRLPYYALAAFGFLLGSLPWWLYNFTHAWAALKAISGPELVETTLGFRFAGLLLFGLPALLGIRPPWSAAYFPWPLMLVALVFYLAVALFLWRAARGGRLDVAPGARKLLALFVLSFLVIFLATNFGIDATGRYLLPLYLPLALATGVLLAAAWSHRRASGVALLLVVLLLNAATTALAASSPDRITTQFDPITSFTNEYDDDLIAFLEEHGETRGYSNYWVTYRLAFLSGETLIFSPELPYKGDLTYTSKDNRYPPYARLAAASPRVAYITSKHPALDQLIRASFAGLGVSYREVQIGVFTVFYDLARPVRPQELNLGFSP